ncbi:hypothetical protein AURDEDRAFT_174316 [Auricularia subglabra TFB-10046 SS5]|nr:hypothetical protein AURDEDRAFT_174316 [Auricularia subglabra TFB-10046 SS5]
MPMEYANVDTSFVCASGQSFHQNGPFVTGAKPVPSCTPVHSRSALAAAASLLTNVQNRFQTLKLALECADGEPSRTVLSDGHLNTELIAVRAMDSIPDGRDFNPHPLDTGNAGDVPRFVSKFGSLKRQHSTDAEPQPRSGHALEPADRVLRVDLHAPRAVHLADVRDSDQGRRRWFGRYEHCARTPLAHDAGTACPVYPSQHVRKIRVDGGVDVPSVAGAETFR